MTYVYGSRSCTNRDQCSPELRKLIDEIIKDSPVDIAIVCGRRGRIDQTAAFHATPQRSKNPWPRSEHNCVLEDGRDTEDLNGESNAFDFAPYVNGIPWEDEGAFYMLAGHILGTANRLGIEVVYGGDWDRDGLTEDQRFMDLGHIQGVRK